MKNVFIFILLVVIRSAGYNIWVSPTGTATLAAARGETPRLGTACCKLDTANLKAQPGDSVLFRGGNYGSFAGMGGVINPTNSGTEGNRIVFTSYNNEDCQFSGSTAESFAVNLDSEYGTIRSYITVNDLHFSNFLQHLWIRRGDYNEISNCTFIGYPTSGYTAAYCAGVYSASYIYRQAKYNWIHGCTFALWGWNADFDYDCGAVIQIGVEVSVTPDSTSYNLFENNVCYSGGHHVMSLNGSYNIYRNNYFHNAPWSPIGSPVYATRVLYQTGYQGDCVYNLAENNRIGYGGPKHKDEIGGGGVVIASMKCIWRKNIFLQNYTYGMLFTPKPDQNPVYKNHIYNNTFWHCGYGRYQYYPSGTAPSQFWDDAYTHPIDVAGDDGTNDSNIIKNNLFSVNSCLYGTQYSIICHESKVVPTHQLLSNNYLDNYSYPKFVDTAGIPDPSNATQWNLNLQSTSSAIDSGTWLTTVTSASGSGAKIKVADAGYFTYPYGGMDTKIVGASVVGDSIQFQGSTTKYVIDSIDYTTDTLYLTSSATWTNGLGVALVYGGNKPDIGAKEYYPAGPRIKYGKMNCTRKW